MIVPTLFSFRKNQLVGLDIGSHAIKIAELNETRRGPQLINFGIVNLPAHIIEDSTIKNPDVVATAIQDLWSNLGIKNKNVVTSISGYSVIIKKISLPTMKDKELENRISIEAEQYIPFEINEVNIDFQILGTNLERENQMDVLLVAAKKDMISMYENMLKKVGLTPKIIDVDVFALGNVYEFNYSAEEEGGVILVDIGANKININILHDGISIFTRDATLGGTQLTYQIRDLLGITVEKAEEIKLGQEKELSNEPRLREVFHSVISSWCHEIKRAIDFVSATFPAVIFKKIYLSGGSAHLVDLREMLKNETNLEVNILDPFRNIIIGKNIDPEYIQQIGPQGAISIGLALRSIEFSGLK